MVSGPITSWQIEGKKVKAVADFIFLGSKITVDSDCSDEIKRCLLLERRAMTNLVKVKVLVAQSCLTLGIPWTVPHQAPLSMEFSRHEC